MIPIFHRKGLVIKHAVIDAQKIHAVWSYKEQIQIPSTGCSLKFESILLQDFLAWVPKIHAVWSYKEQW